MKKNLFFVLALLAVVSAFTACSDKGKSDSNGSQATESDTDSGLWALAHVPVGSEWIDPEFANVLQKKGLIEDAETVTPADVADISSVDVVNRKLTSLRGIEYFVSLEELDCYLNKLTRLDVSKNTQLKELSCFLNELTQLNVSKNTRLEKLDCHKNQLKQLDVSKNTRLERLVCDENQLTQLDINSNKMLRELFCGSNELTKLDISNNPKLYALSCFYNPGANGLFRVKAQFDNSDIPFHFPKGSWQYGRTTVSMDYYK